MAIEIAEIYFDKDKKESAEVSVFSDSIIILTDNSHEYHIYEKNHKVVAMPGNVFHCYEGSKITVYNDCTVYAYNGSDITIQGNGRVEAYKGATVRGENSPNVHHHKESKPSRSLFKRKEPSSELELTEAKKLNAPLNKSLQ